MDSLQQEASAFDSQFEERIANSHIPDLRRTTMCEYFYANLYITKTPVTAADLLNDRVPPFYESHELAVLRNLTGRGTEYCANRERHYYL